MNPLLLPEMLPERAVGGGTGLRSGVVKYQYVDLTERLVLALFAFVPSYLIFY